MYNIHQDELNEFYDDMIRACLEASNLSIPRSGCIGKVPMPGCDNYVREHRERAILWHKMWQENGSPRNGMVADIRTATRGKYHYAVRYAQRNKEQISSGKKWQRLW